MIITMPDHKHINIQEKHKITNMKISIKKIVAAGLLLVSAHLLKAQQISVNNFRVYTDIEHYLVNPGYDTTFVKVLEVEISDTVNISKIDFSIQEMASTKPLKSKLYNFKSANDKDMTKEWAYERKGKKLRISMGILGNTTRYHTEIKINGLQNQLLGTGLYEF